MVALRVLVFYVLTLTITFLLGGAQGALEISSRMVIFPQLAPGLGGLFTLLIFRSDQPRITLFKPGFPFSRYILAGLIPAGGAAVIYFINRYLMDGIPVTDLSTVPWMLVLWMPVGALGEELGWRAFLHKQLDDHLSGLRSSMLVGAFWAVWHVGLYANGLLYMIFFVILMMAYSMVIYALVSDTGYSLVLAAIFHLGINLTNLFSIDAINEINFMITSSLVWVAIAAAAVMLNKPRFLQDR